MSRRGTSPRDRFEPALVAVDGGGGGGGGGGVGRGGGGGENRSDMPLLANCHYRRRYT